LVDLTDARAFTDHVVLDIDFFLQPLVFAFQPFDVARVLQGHCND
jgi:hypothetical protein